MVNRQRGNEKARPDELGKNPGQVGPDSAGQSGDPQQLSSRAEADSESVQELADTDQALEAGIVEGVEDAADHPERPVHTHLDYGRPDDLPPRAGVENRRRQEKTRLTSRIFPTKIRLPKNSFDSEQVDDSLRGLLSESASLSDLPHCSVADSPAV